MSKEIRLRVAEAKQRDAGRGKARIDDATMRALGIVAGDLIEMKGKGQLLQLLGRRIRKIKIKSSLELMV